jgi:hypothetical protein
MPGIASKGIKGLIQQVERLRQPKYFDVFSKDFSGYPIHRGKGFPSASWKHKQSRLRLSYFEGEELIHGFEGFLLMREGTPAIARFFASLVEIDGAVFRHRHSE